MARRQRELDPDGGPVVEFARGLRELRAAAGDPKFAAMARRAGRSKTALAEAAGGRRLPRWETVEGFVRACDGDPVPWRARWLDARRRLDDRVAAVPEIDADAAPPAAVDPAPDDPAPGDPAASVAAGRRVGRGVAVAILVATAVVAVLAGFIAGRLTAGPEPWEVPLLRAIEVQNKVALGADRLEEDRTPAYLSTLPLAYCASPDRQCKVPGTELRSGAALVAHCVVRGQQMWNYDLRDPAVDANPDRAASALWYRASFPDGRVGYLSEVYLSASSRGGLGLPDCSPGA